tara:strand:- start:945 stop:1451 length:507 start_codon:yes stop_codon:yes gene_type:complete
MIKEILSKKSFLNFSIVFFIFLLDRISKLIVVHLVDKNNNSELFLSKFLNIQLIWNEGVAFGLLSFEKENLYNILTFIILIIIIVICFMIVKTDGIKKYPLILILGGALGNAYDRVFYKAVPDFIDLHIEESHWFIFNIADVFITFGVFFMILGEFIGKNKYEDYEKN